MAFAETSNSPSALLSLMKKTNRVISSKRPQVSIVILLVIIAIALFLLKNSFLDNRKNVADTSTSTLPSTSQPTRQNSLPTPTPPADSPLTSAKHEPAQVPSVPEETTVQADTACQKIAAELLLFCKHLDSQKYIQAYTETEPIQKHLDRIITKILDNPPVNEKETADLLTVLKNAAHLFRILGPKDLSLLREIITTESSSLEQQLAWLYAWSTAGKGCDAKAPVQAQFPLAKTYEYAAFFLNTLGGQSYLARRAPAVRVLTRYYCVLILHQAVRQSSNRYHLDLAYHLKAITNDISNSDFLENQASYLDTLQKIKAGI